MRRRGSVGSSLTHHSLRPARVAFYRKRWFIMSQQYSQNAVVRTLQLAAIESSLKPLWPISREEPILSQEGLTVLVVDDEPNIVEVVSAYLHREMFNVVTAGDGETALRRFAEYNPDL